MQKMQRSVSEAEADYQVAPEGACCCHPQLTSNLPCSTSHSVLQFVAEQAEVTELEAVVEEVQDQFQSLDQQMSHASQTATKIGDRLQVCMLELLCCLFILSIFPHKLHMTLTQSQCYQRVQRT